MPIEMCHCGRPLHYTNLQAKKLVKELIRQKGPIVLVTAKGRTWLVPRHYLALHGLKESELPHLGFKEAV